MEDEEGYMALNPRSKTEQRTENPPSPEQDIQQPPQWYRVALMVACSVILLLVGTSIALAVREDVTDCKICPKNWRFYKDNCYWISEGKKNWSQSQVACRAKNSTLVGLQDIEEKAFIEHISTERLWLGLIAKQSEKWEWEWADGSPLEDSELLSALGPAGKDKCGVLDSTSIFFEPCDDTSQWICKKAAFST